MTLYNHPHPIQLFMQQMIHYNNRLIQERAKGHWRDMSAYNHLQKELDRIKLNAPKFYN